MLVGIFGAIATEIWISEILASELKCEQLYFSLHLVTSFGDVPGFQKKPDKSNTNWSLKSERVLKFIMFIAAFHEENILMFSDVNDYLRLLT